MKNRDKILIIKKSKIIFKKSNIIMKKNDNIIKKKAININNRDIKMKIRFMVDQKLVQHLARVNHNNN